MASVNRVIVLGNLGRDPEMRYLPSGEAIANLRIATTEKFKDKSGAAQEITEWHSVAFFGKIAEVCGQYLKKGGQVYIEGSLRTRKWQDKDGQDRYTTEIRGDRMQMLGSRQGGEQHGSDTDSRADQGTNTQSAPASSNAGSSAQPAFDDDDDSIPF